MTVTPLVVDTSRATPSQRDIWTRIEPLATFNPARAQALMAEASSWEEAHEVAIQALLVTNELTQHAPSYGGRGREPWVHVPIDLAQWLDQANEDVWWALMGYQRAMLAYLALELFRQPSLDLEQALSALRWSAGHLSKFPVRSFAESLFVHPMLAFGVLSLSPEYLTPTRTTVLQLLESFNHVDQGLAPLRFPLEPKAQWERTKARPVLPGQQINFISPLRDYHEARFGQKLPPAIARSLAGRVDRVLVYGKAVTEAMDLSLADIVIVLVQVEQMQVQAAQQAGIDPVYNDLLALLAQNLDLA